LGVPQVGKAARCGRKLLPTRQTSLIGILQTFATGQVYAQAGELSIVTKERDYIVEEF